MNTIINELNNSELINVNGGDNIDFEGYYNQFKYIYKDLRSHWGDIEDFAMDFTMAQLETNVK